MISDFLLSITLSLITFRLCEYSFYVTQGYYSNISLMMLLLCAVLFVIARETPYVLIVKTSYNIIPKPSTKFASTIPLL